MMESSSSSSSSTVLTKLHQFRLWLWHSVPPVIATPLLQLTTTTTRRRRSILSPAEAWSIQLGSTRIRGRKRLRPRGIILVAALILTIARTSPMVFLESPAATGSNINSSSSPHHHHHHSHSISLPSSSSDISRGQQQHHTGLHHSSQRIANPPPLVVEPEQSSLRLERFPSLQYPLRHADMIALFFSTPSAEQTRMVRDHFSRSERLLAPPTYDDVGRPRPADGAHPQHHPLAIVYVSDHEASSEWIYVSNPQERFALMKKFRTWLPRDSNRLGGSPVFQVPSMFIVDCMSRAIVTIDGLEDVKQLGSDAYEKWVDFRTLVGGVPAINGFFNDDDAT